MSKSRINLFAFSLIPAAFMVLWTLFLPSWPSNEWFVSKWIQNMWIGFDVILSIFLIALSFGIYHRKTYARFLAPLIFGMVITDWIFNLQLWYFGGYDLLESRFLLSFIFVLATLSYFYWFTTEVQKESMKWDWRFCKWLDDAYELLGNH